MQKKKTILGSFTWPIIEIIIKPFFNKTYFFMKICLNFIITFMILVFIVKNIYRILLN